MTSRTGQGCRCRDRANSDRSGSDSRKENALHGSSPPEKVPDKKLLKSEKTNKLNC
jgi:hypothetical protein